MAEDSLWAQVGHKPVKKAEEKKEEVAEKPEKKVEGIVGEAKEEEKKE